MALLAAHGAGRPSQYILASGIAYYTALALARPRVSRPWPLRAAGAAAAVASAAAALEEAGRIAGW